MPPPVDADTASRASSSGLGRGGVSSLAFGWLGSTLMWLTGTGDEVRELTLRAIAALAKTALRLLTGG